MAGHERIGGESAAREAGWKARIARFYPPRNMAHVVLTVSGAYLAAILAIFLAEVFDLLDMDGHDALEEPIRAFIYHSLRALAVPIGIGCLVSIACFGIATVVLLSVRRTPVLRAGRDPVR